MSTRSATPTFAYRCPTHQRELIEEPEQLRCPSGHSFPIIGGVPRFVRCDDYAESFGRQWNRFRLTQLDSHTGLPLSKERALRCLGLSRDSNGNGSLLPGQEVLEVGCGAGRFTEVLLELGAIVTSVDLSSAVEANATNFPPDVAHRVVQADVRALPFPSRQFDGVFCLGVVQHTPVPEATVKTLYEHVRPGGWLVFDHYAVSVSTATWLGMHMARQVFKRLPIDRRLPATERMVDRLLPIHAACARIGRTLARALSRVSPVLTYYHVHPELPDDLQREWAILDTHDALTDVYKHHRAQRQIESYLIGLGLTEVVVVRAGNGIEARGRRPTGNT